MKNFKKLSFKINNWNLLRNSNKKNKKKLINYEIKSN